MTDLSKKFKYQAPLRAVLIVPFVLQIFAAVSLVGYLSFKNGQQAIDKLAQQLQHEVANRVDKHLDTYLALPHQINEINLDATKQGVIDLKDIKSAGRYFWKQAQVFKQFSFIGYALADNTGAGAGRWLEGQDIVISQHSGGSLKDYAYAADKLGNQRKLVHQADYDATTDIWYVDTVKAGKPIWSRIYTSEGFGTYIAASANTPIYDKNHKLLGVLGIDLLLSDISKFLRQINISRSGQVFILERDGRLIASSGSQPIITKKNNEIKRYSIFNNPDPLVRALAKDVQQKFQTLQSIQSTQNLDFFINGKRHYVKISSWKDEYGLDWLVVVTVPESNFMEQINVNTRTTIVLCLIALVMATLLGIHTSRWITRPILTLNQAAKAIAEGNLEQQVANSRIQELNSVGQSFNYMAGQLQTSFAALEHSNQELEKRVTERTEELSNKNSELNDTLIELRRTQTQMVQSEKMSALGQMVAGVAHEINNPVGFIHGNLEHVKTYTHDILELVQAYQQYFPNPPEVIQEQIEDIDLAFINKDFPEILRSMEVGTERIREIFLSLRNFSRLDEYEFKVVNLHEGIDNTLLILHHRLEGTACRPAMKIIKEYSELPLVECYAGQLNQVFMNLLSNAVDALEETNQERTFTQIENNLNTIWIHTTVQDNNWVTITIADNGSGIPDNVHGRLFDPFFTTKPVGKGTGLGLSISYQIITEKHHGKLWCDSAPGKGAKFCIEIPIRQTIQRN